MFALAAVVACVDYFFCKVNKLREWEVNCIQGDFSSDLIGL